MSKIKLTREEFAKHLDKNQPPFESDKWILGGKRRDVLAKSGKYSRAMRRHNNQLFELLFMDWVRDY